jgi:hypothetical protein
LDELPKDPSHSESSAGTQTPGGCLAKVVYGIGWILLYGFTLDRLGTILSEHLVRPSSQEGYAASLGIGSVFFFVPFGLFVSFLVLTASKRRWVFFVMAVALASVIAFGLALM